MAATIPPSSEVDLKAFLAGAGRSLADAQGTLGAEINLTTDLVIASAELEAKVTLKSDTTGNLAVQPISSADLQKSDLNAAGISTLRVNFVATAGELPTAVQPNRTAAEVIADVRKRPDVVNLEKILGPLKIETTFVAQANRWMVTATDPKGRSVREVIVPDAVK